LQTMQMDIFVEFALVV